MQWLALEEFAATIPALDIERSRHPEDLGPSEFVKDSTVRTVMRLPDPDDPAGPGLYLKRYKFRDRNHRLKHLIVSTKPATEWKVCRALQAVGIPTCDVLAIALRRRHGLYCEGFLVSREIEGAVGLPEFVRERLRTVQKRIPGYRRELIEELASLTARLMDEGFYHHDYHLGNLLVKPDAPAGERLYVVDLHAIRLRRPGRRGVLRMLAMLGDAKRLPAVSGRDQRRFLTALFGLWKGGPGADDKAVGRLFLSLDKTHHKLWRRRMRSRTRRCVLESTLFTKEKTSGFLIHRRRDFPVESALQAVRLHTAAVAGQEADVAVFRKGRRTEVTVCPCNTVPPFGVNRPAAPRDVKPGNVCVKCFRRDSLAERLKDTLRLRSRARAAWIASQGFKVRGVPAARPLALLESRRKLSGGPDYLITEALENDGNLWEVLQERLPKGAPRRKLGKAIADLLNLLDQKETYHPDTKPTNFLVKETDGEFRLWLVDLDRVRFNTSCTWTRWVKLLARLNAGLPADVTLLDRMRCLRQCGLDASNRLPIARQVYELSLRRRPAWLRQG